MHIRNADKPVVLIAAVKWWPLSARLASALLRGGCSVDVLCPAHHPLTYVAGIGRSIRYSSIDSLGSLRRAIYTCNPDIIVPCDDGVVAQLHVLHGQDPALRSAIENSLGPATCYPIIDSRLQFLRMASDLGIFVPRTESIRHPEDLGSWHKNNGDAGVLKIDGSCGGVGVRIFRSPAESLAAFHDLAAKTGLLRTWKRVAIDREPLALWMHGIQHRIGMTVQSLMRGRPANSMIACLRGTVLGIVSVAVVVAEGETGAAIIVRTIHDQRMTRNARLIAERLQLTGFYGLDYLITPDDGVPCLLEMNPRCTQLGHLEFDGFGSLVQVFCDALRGSPDRPLREPIQSKMISFFPQALAFGEICRPYIEQSYHDVPRDEPRLLHALQLQAWPQRQLASRLYRAIRPLEKTEPVIFEELPVRNPASTPGLA